MHGYLSFRPSTVNAGNVSGKNLRRLLHGKPAWARAQIAATLVRGERTLTNLLPAQASRIRGVPPAYVSVALNGRPISRPVVTEAEVDRIVSELGPERVLGALDRATAPNGGARGAAP